MKTDSLGRTRQKSQGGAGPKPLPGKSRGSITGDLEAHDMPEDLDEHGVEFWDKATTAMRAMGILEKMDWCILYIAADSFSRWKRAQRDIAAHGELISNDKGDLKRNPAFITLEKHSVMLKSYSSELGLTPSARAKFGPVEEDDPFAALMGHAKEN